MVSTTFKTCIISHSAGIKTRVFLWKMKQFRVVPQLLLFSIPTRVFHHSGLSWFGEGFVWELDKHSKGSPFDIGRKFHTLFDLNRLEPVQRIKETDPSQSEIFKLIVEWLKCMCILEPQLKMWKMTDPAPIHLLYKRRKCPFLDTFYEILPSVWFHF